MSVSVSVRVSVSVCVCSKCLCVIVALLNRDLVRSDYSDPAIYRGGE